MNPLAEARLFGGIALAVALFVAGWTANGWRLTSAHEKQARQAAQEAAESLRLATVDRDALAARLRASNDIHAQELQNAQAETNRVRDAAASGAVRMRVAARCPDVPQTPSAASSSGLGDGTGAELDGTARQAYFALRDGIDRASAQLAACQAELSLRVR